jgi:hypothetical protein
MCNSNQHYIIIVPIAKPYRYIFNNWHNWISKQE